MVRSPAVLLAVRRATRIWCSKAWEASCLVLRAGRPVVQLLLASTTALVQFVEMQYIMCNTLRRRDPHSHRSVIPDRPGMRHIAPLWYEHCRWWSGGWWRRAYSSASGTRQGQIKTIQTSRAEEDDIFQVSSIEFGISESL